VHDRLRRDEVGTDAEVFTLEVFDPPRTEQALEHALRLACANECDPWDGVVVERPVPHGSSRQRSATSSGRRPIAYSAPT
jgi:hypothetical protein